MKPFKYKNKVSFGDFKSAMEAARAVDVAFYYYDKNKWRNFRDSPAFLPPLPGALSEEGKLKFVKEQARSLAFMALHLPSTWDPANRCDEYKPGSSHPSGSVIVKPDEALFRSAELEIPARTETLIQQAVLSLDVRSKSEESGFLVQQLEDMMSSTEAQIAEESPTILPVAKTGETEFQLAPEFLDEDELWNLQTRTDDLMTCEEQKGALDVDDYIDMQVPALEPEHGSVQRSI